MQMLVTSNINNLLAGLQVGKQKSVLRTIKFVTRLVKYAEKKMKYYAPSKSKRSTGNLKSKITSTIKAGTRNIRGIAFVPRGVKYQFVVEFGRKFKSKAIRGKPLMRFPVENWKKGSRNPNILKLSRNGYFIFSIVSQGRMKGKFFTKRAYKDLLKFYDKQKQNYVMDLKEFIILRKY